MIKVYKHNVTNLFLPLHMNTYTATLCLKCCKKCGDQSRAAQAHICKRNREADHISADSWVHRKPNTYAIPLYLMTDDSSGI